MTAAAAIAAWLTNIRCSGLLSAVAVGTLLALSQIVIRPLLITGSLLAIRTTALPLLVFCYLAANVLIFWTVGFIVPGFYVPKLSSAIGGAIITGIFGFIIHSSLRIRLSMQATRIRPQEQIEQRDENGMKQAKGRVIR
jgi:uncharacterized membrane protein YvlD (DUF360 family)